VLGRYRMSDATVHSNQAMSHRTTSRWVIALLLLGAFTLHYSGNAGRVKAFEYRTEEGGVDIEESIPVNQCVIAPRTCRKPFGLPPEGEEPAAPNENPENTQP
jgi:hypothetical protein